MTATRPRPKPQLCPTCAITTRSKTGYCPDHKPTPPGRRENPCANGCGAITRSKIRYCLPCRQAAGRTWTDVELAGGRWVSARGIQVWEPDYMNPERKSA